MIESLIIYRSEYFLCGLFAGLNAPQFAGLASHSSVAQSSIFFIMKMKVFEKDFVLVKAQEPLAKDSQSNDGNIEKFEIYL